MGVEFIQKASASLKKSWDRHRVELATPDFFTQQPEVAVRTFAADIVNNATVQEGDHVIVAVNGVELVAMDGLIEVARFTNSPIELVEAVRKAYGMAHGTVRKVHELSRVVEISIC